MAWPTTSRHARGYGTAHDRMRKRVLKEEPLCYICLAVDPPRFTPSAIADHKVPKSKGGGDERKNYGGCCKPCHDAKTAEEKGHKPKTTIGVDGWPA